MTCGCNKGQQGGGKGYKHRHTKSCRRKQSGGNPYQDGYYQEGYPSQHVSPYSQPSSSYSQPSSSYSQQPRTYPSQSYPSQSYSSQSLTSQSTTPPLTPQPKKESSWWPFSGGRHRRTRRVNKSRKNKKSRKYRR